MRQLILANSGPQDYDSFIKDVNTAMYYGTSVRISGTGAEKVRIKQMGRMHEIYGDRFYELVSHTPFDPEVGEMLIKDALKTGKWKELPDELQAEYHQRKDKEL